MRLSFLVSFRVYSSSFLGKILSLFSENKSKLNIKSRFSERRSVELYVTYLCCYCVALVSTGHRS